LAERKARGDWLVQTQSRDGVDKKKKKKKRRGTRESSERTKRSNNAAKRYGWKNVAGRKRAKGSDEECIRRGWSGRVKARGGSDVANVRAPVLDIN